MRCLRHRRQRVSQFPPRLISGETKGAGAAVAARPGHEDALTLEPDQAPDCRLGPYQHILAPFAGEQGKRSVQLVGQMDRTGCGCVARKLAAGSENQPFPSGQNGAPYLRAGFMQAGQCRAESVSETHAAAPDPRGPQARSKRRAMRTHADEAGSIGEVEASVTSPAEKSQRAPASTGNDRIAAIVAARSASRPCQPYAAKHRPSPSAMTALSLPCTSACKSAESPASPKLPSASARPASSPTQMHSRRCREKSARASSARGRPTSRASACKSSAAALGRASRCSIRSRSALRRLCASQVRTPSGATRTRERDATVFKPRFPCKRRS